MDRFSILLKPIILVHYKVFKKEYYIHVNFCGSCCFVFFLMSLISLFLEFWFAIFLRMWNSMLRFCCFALSSGEFLYAMTNFPSYFLNISIIMLCICFRYFGWSSCLRMGD